MDGKKDRFPSSNEKQKLKGAVQKDLAESYAQTRDETNERRGEKYRKQRQKEKNDHIDYLNQMEHRKASPLHKQPRTTKATKKFYKKFNQFKLVQCSECSERWHAPANSKEQKAALHQCARFKRELTFLSRPSNRRTLGKANDVQPGRFPPCARNLTQIEELLVSPIITCMHVYTVQGEGKRIIGNCITCVQQDQVNQL